MMITLINPNIVSQKGDFSGSGIPYMPIGLAYLASYLKNLGHDIYVIDAFGEAPHQVSRMKTHYIQGLTPEEVVERIPFETQVIGFYAHLTVSHNVLLEIIRLAKKRFPHCCTLVLENVDKVNAYSLRQVYKDFFKFDVDYIVLGYLEKRTQRLLEAIQQKRPVHGLDGVIARGKESQFIPPHDFNKETNLDELPFPAWDLFPLEKYWRLGYSHGPLTSDKYLPLLTSRGCPYNCGFCIAPEVSARKWKARSAENVVNEIVYFQQKFGVNEFHIEDLNPTLNRKRIIELCRLLIERNIRITWKLAQGTKLESLDSEVIDLMAKAGCNYVSISPESGSPRMLKLMDKPVNLDYSIEVVQLMKERGIYTQACFVLGYPGENKADLAQTANLVRKLAKVGVDEIALFIITPMPGSRIYQHYKDNLHTFDQLTFTPKWRDDYKKLSIFRKKLYLQYVVIKFFYHPTRLLGYGWAFLNRRFRTKVEMTIFRKIKVAWFAMGVRRNTN
jgi:radical SAM superfamily enzyme YgiQ (UPF0313 family)